MNEIKIEKAARALARYRVLKNMWNENRPRDEGMIQRAVDYAWGDFRDQAVAVITALDEIDRKSRT